MVSCPRFMLLVGLSVLRRLNKEGRTKFQKPGPSLTCTALPKTKARALHTHPGSVEGWGQGTQGPFTRS